MAEPRIDLQRLLDEAPFVQSLARRLVRDAADDVVQQTWLQALEQRPLGFVDPRRWLARVVRNLAADGRRRERRRRERERAAAGTGGVAAPSSVELLAIEERRRSLVAAVDALPEMQREVVLFRYYEGLPPRRIARRLGVSAKSVHNRLYAALQTLRSRLDRDHGHRRAWLLALVPLAAAPRALPWREVLPDAGAPTVFTGLIAMTMKSKLVAAAAAVLALILAWAVWPVDDRPAPPSADGEAGGPLLGQVPPDEPSVTPWGDDPRREVAAQTARTAAATTGSLTVRVLHATEPTAGVGITVTVFPRGGDFRVGAHKRSTDAEGRVTFAALAPGTYTVRAARAERGANVEVRAGETSEHDFRLSASFVLTGVVVDASGTPIPGALVEIGSGAQNVDIEVVATTAADGTFTLRDCPRHSVVGARANGFASSTLHYLDREPGERHDVRIELREPGGTVEGLVVRGDGTPVPDAVVKVGAGNTSGIRTTPMGAAPVAALVRTDQDGRFSAIGVPVGEQPLVALAPGFAPWSGTCEVDAGLVTAAHIVMQPGVRCQGSVRTDAGEPVAGARVTAGASGDFTQLVRYSDASGAFVMDGLPAGTTEIAAWHQEHGKGSADVAGTPGESVRCELVLTKGLMLRGRVVDEGDQPLPGVAIECRTLEPPWFIGWDRTDDDGRFEVINCPAGRRVAVTANASGRPPVVRRDVDPEAGELVLVLTEAPSPRARITGRVLGPDGRPAAGVDLRVTMRDPQLDRFGEPEADGSFALEVAEGKWLFQCTHRDHPTIRMGPRTLRQGEVWDLGVLTLTHGGRVVVRHGANAELPGKPSYLVFDNAEEFVCGIYSPDPPPRSELLAPGDFLLLVRGDGIAAHAVPFAVRSGETTEVEVELEPGVVQRIEFAAGPGVELGHGVSFRLHRDGKLVTVSSASGDPPARDLWLEPGSYTLMTSDRAPATTVDFTVGTTAGDPLRVQLR